MLKTPVCCNVATVASREEERQLIERILDGDEEAFAELLDAHYSALIRLAMTFVRSRNVAEEVVQETWIAVLNGLSKFEGRSALKTWIFRILINRAKSRGVKEARSLPFSALGEDDEDRELASDAERFTSDGTWREPPEQLEDVPEQLLIQKETRQVMEEAIKKLPENQQRVITLRDLEGWSSADVCNVLDISETNQRVLLHRARTRVRKAIEKYLKRK